MPSVPTTMLLLAYVTLLAGKAQFPTVGPLAGVEFRWLLAYALLVLWLFWRHNTAAATWPAPLRRYWTIAVAFHTYLALTTLWAPTFAPIWPLLADVALLVVIVSIAIDVMRQNPQAADMLIRVVAATSLLYAIGAVVEGPSAQGRYSAFGGGPNVFVRVESMGVIAGTYLAARTRSIRWWGVVVVSLAGVALSGSRGGLLALGVSGLLLAPHALASLSRSRVLGRAISALVVLAAGAWWVLGDSIASVVMPRIVQLTLIDQYSSGRDGLYDAALIMFSERPILGWGLGGFYAEEGTLGGFYYAHNILLNIGAEAGLVGLFLFLGALAVGLRSTRWLSSAAGPAHAMAVSGIYFFVAGLFSGGYYDLRFGWFFLGVAIISRFSIRLGEPADGEVATSPGVRRD